MDFFAAQARAQTVAAAGLGLRGLHAGCGTCAEHHRLTALRIGGAAGRNHEPYGASLAEWAAGHPATVMLVTLVAGVPMPEVYVIERDDGINAFAAGHTPSDAAVAVTRGALLNLNRDRLQGVIAHEFSHILNGDMRLSMRLE
jgi:Zn-dependent protease with chaperone function